MSTTVVYASGESGRINCGNATYLTAARGDGTVGVAATDASTLVGQGLGSGTYYVYEGFHTWDTSAVGTDTVSAVAFEVEGYSFNNDGTITVETYAYAWGSTLTSADFRDSDTGIPALGSIIASYDTAGGFDTGTGYNNDLGALTAFNSAINGAGNTEVVVLASTHRTESAPPSDPYYERVGYRNTGATNDARLTITHSSATLYTAIDDDPDTPDAVVITATAS